MTDYTKVPSDYFEMWMAIAKILFAMVAASTFAYVQGYKRGRRAGLKAKISRTKLEEKSDKLTI